MSLLGTLGKLASSVAKAYSDASKKKNNSSSSNKTTSSSSYKPVGSNTDEYIRQTNSSDYNAIQAAKQAYQEAAKAGDQEGMTNANRAANDIRAKYGYSGGTDGRVGSGKPIQYILLELEPGKELQLGHLENQMVHYILVVEVVEINQQLKVPGLQIQVMEVTVEDGIQVISLAVGLGLP